MAKEYIERGAAIKEIRLIYCKDCNSYNGVRCRACEFDDAMSLIEDVPAADVVEVVRCKDCKYFVSEVCRCDLALNFSRGDDFAVTEKGRRRQHEDY